MIFLWEVEGEKMVGKVRKAPMGRKPQTCEDAYLEWVPSLGVAMCDQGTNRAGDGPRVTAEAHSLPEVLNPDCWGIVYAFCLLATWRQDP